MLKIEDITYSVEGRPLFEGASATIPTGHKVGLVGRNGAGKTTLFRLIKKELALEKTLEKARKYVAGERRNTALARLEAEKAEERRRNACATAERRRRKLEKLQATGGTAGQKH